jgi:hypothetical protein
VNAFRYILRAHLGRDMITLHYQPSLMNMRDLTPEKVKSAPVGGSGGP